MDSLNNNGGLSTYSNNLDYDFDPLLTRPAVNTDWVAQSTPKNYVRQKEDLIRFSPVVLLKRATEVISNTVTSLLNGTPKPVDGTPKPVEGVLIDLSTGSNSRCSYPNGTEQLNQKQIKKRIKRERRKILKEWQRLENHIQQQDWYKELAEVFTMPTKTDIPADPALEQEPEQPPE